MSRHVIRQLEKIPWSRAVLLCLKLSPKRAFPPQCAVGSGSQFLTDTRAGKSKATIQEQMPVSAKLRGCLHETAKVYEMAKAMLSVLCTWRKKGPWKGTAGQTDL